MPTRRSICEHDVDDRPLIQLAQMIKTVGVTVTDESMNRGCATTTIAIKLSEDDDR